MVMRARSKAEEYRQIAEEADRLAVQAEEVGNPVAVETYRGLASKWRAIADKAERWGL
jgi:hypothetical protein